MIRTKQYSIFLPFVLLLIFLIYACDKFEGDQTIPSYIEIDTIGFSSDNAIEGTDAQNILDVWVYVNDQLIGGFEMPTRIPVLAQGASKIEIRPGIKLNGISATRAPYPYFIPLIFEDHMLIPDSVISITGTSHYRSNTEFIWMEDFEDASLAIVEYSGSDTGIYRTMPPNLEGAFLDEYSEHSGIVYLDSERPYVLLLSDDGNGEGFPLRQGDFIFLELHYKTNFPLITGMIIKHQDGSVEKRYLIGVNPTDIWKKVYVNFSPMVNESAGAINFKVFFEAKKESEEQAGKIWLDNIKLLSRQNL